MIASVLKICIPLRQSRGLYTMGVSKSRQLSSQLLRYSPVGYRLHTSPFFSNLTQRHSQSQASAVPSMSRLFHVSALSSQGSPGQQAYEQERLVSQMNIRLINENSFLSWCRNAYLSTVVGVAMMSEGASALAQSAGLGALLVGTMNLVWGTGCHVTNLIRLRHVSGMSSVTLFLHLIGSLLHCVLWAFVLTCYIGFLDESNWPEDEEGEKQDAGGDSGRRRRLGEGLRRV